MRRTVSSVLPPKTSCQRLGIIIILAGFFSSSTLNLLAQRVGFTAGGTIGYTWPHRPDLKPIAGGTAWSIDLGYVKPFNHQSWARWQGFPIQSFNVTVGGFGNAPVFGQYVGVNQHHLIPFGRWSGQGADWRRTAFVGLGYGAAYLNKTNDEAPQNIAFGSHLNALIWIEPGYSIGIGEGRVLQVGGRLTHLSNAAATLPNLGLNPLSVFARITTFANKGRSINVPEAEIDLLPGPRRFAMDVRTILGVKQADYPGGPRVFTYGLIPRFMYARSAGWRFSTGPELTYNGQAATYLRSQRLYDGKTDRAFRAGAVLGAEANLGHTSLMAEVGYTVFDQLTYSPRFYQRLGAQWHWKSASMGKGHSPYVGAYLKSAQFVADYLEFGVGYRF